MENINPTIPNFYVGAEEKTNWLDFENGDKKLQKNVLFTLAYYAGQDYPLSTFEVWRRLCDIAKNGKADFLMVVRELENLREKKMIIKYKGMWSLSSRQDGIFNRRIARQKTSEREIKKARKWARAAFLLPYVRGIFCFGTLGMKKAGARSDWDVLVVLEEGKIWIGRFFISAFFQLFGKRRTDKMKKGRFCLNHFLAQDGLIMEERNEFTSKEISHSFSLAGDEQFQRYMQLNEFWMKKYLPNFSKDWMAGSQSEFEKKAKQIRKYQEKILNVFGLGKLLNEISKKLMISKIKANKKTYYKGADIRYNDQALVFLPKPQREALMAKALENLNSLNLARS